MLDKDLTVQQTAGQVKLGPVGSTAVRAAVERYQPLAGLHGHVHESRGAARLGKTVALNPGSEYGNGLLRGLLAEVRQGQVKKHQWTCG